ncbi:DUF871 domain-containing protein [Vagococcus xieshaowenii]|uniref:DUF871 domain-containing protein n=1 Tax=Vagococcus xieshaowenii TaxID=2562451 RepID=A0AAJ5JL10_9ENTE|nr:MupG family TIM beta-alpha barrel fold protein [Vagococcus xieshaowenii]QCA27940.1 DUF871 domain-containing protein [Vagococcus xieshaowenii]TFZ40325.1 DUF871 domain-containing protein [Vagococcus xieshaowenii]
MLGFSIFFSEAIDSETENYIKKMKAAGFEGVFSSLHIPEDDTSTYKEKLQTLGNMLKKYQLNLMVDISTLGLKALGYDIQSKEDIEAIKALGITGLRMDYGISFDVIAQLSQWITVSLNASTLTVEEVAYLKEQGANFSNLELWHNYYPRVETGLAMETFKQKNELFHHLGLKICAFVPGDHQLRGPLFEGLPTVEDHRYQAPLVSTVSLLDAGYVSDVYIGDPGIKEATMTQFFDYFKQQRVSLKVEVLDATHERLFIGTHTNRVDDARDVIRSQEARFKELPIIEPHKTLVRTKGSVTLDNEKYGRYKGELQLTKVDLPLDERVNVVARVIEEDQALIKVIKPGMSYRLVNYKGA